MTKDWFKSIAPIPSKSVFNCVFAQMFRDSDLSSFRKPASAENQSSSHHRHTLTPGETGLCAWVVNTVRHTQPSSGQFRLNPQGERKSFMFVVSNTSHKCRFICFTDAIVTNLGIQLRATLNFMSLHPEYRVQRYGHLTYFYEELGVMHGRLAFHPLRYNSMQTFKSQVEPLMLFSSHQKKNNKNMHSKTVSTRQSFRNTHSDSFLCLECSHGLVHVSSPSLFLTSSSFDDQ